MSVTARALLAALSGVFVVLALPGAFPAGALPLAFAAFGPLFLAVRNEPPTRAALFGLVSGATMTAIGFRFLVPAATRAGLSLPLALLALLGFALVQGARVGVHTWASAVAARAGAHRVLAFGAAFLATEACVPHLVAWSFAATLVEAPWLVQSAEVWGATPIAAALVVTGAALFDLAWPAKGARRSWAAAIVAPAWLVMALLGALRAAAIDRRMATALHTRVGVVQGALSPGPHDLAALVDQITSHRALVISGAGLVVWSEGAIPGFVDADTTRLVASLVGETRTIVGADFVEGGARFNAALAFGGGALVGRHDKRALLPFSESDVTPGRDRGPVAIGDLRLALLICYEDVLAGEVGLSGGADSDFLVNLTNDGWFDGTDEPELHLAQARLRTIERRRAMVRATNTGVSAIVDANGRVLARGALGRADVLSGDVPRLRGGTIFGALEPFFPVAWGVGFLAMAMGNFVARRRRRAGKTRPEEDP